MHWRQNARSGAAHIAMLACSDWRHIGGSGDEQASIPVAERGGTALAAACPTRKPRRQSGCRSCGDCARPPCDPPVAMVCLRPGEPADDRLPRPVGQPADQQGLYPSVGSDQVAGLRARGE